MIRPLVKPMIVMRPSRRSRVDCQGVAADRIVDPAFAPSPPVIVFTASRNPMTAGRDQRRSLSRRRAWFRSKPSHPRPRGAAEIDSGKTGAARRAVHEKPLSGLQFGAPRQRDRP
jgi:hypothetical protein